jgi:CRP-like cAMP-binding protein
MPDLYEKVMLLKNSDIFRQVNTDDLRLVADKLEQQSFHAGDHVFDRNDYGDDMYIIVSGRVGIAIDCRSADNYIAELGAGDCFGEMNLLDELPRSASAIVLEDVQLLTLGKQKLRGLILSYPELALGMLKALSLNLRRTTRLLDAD